MEEFLKELTDAEVAALMYGIEIIDEGDYGWFESFWETIRACRAQLYEEYERRDLSWKKYQRP